MSGGPFRDAHGCLTERGLAALRHATTGQAPPELATHVAACDRCQTRLLASDPIADGPALRRPRAPSLMRWVIVCAVALALALLALVVASLLR
jgi:hypothetical protein